MTPLSFNLRSVDNICFLINNYEPFFCYLLSGIKIEFGNYEDFEYMACTSSSISIQEKFIEEVQKDKSKLDEFIFIFLHEIYHIYLHHNWRYGFNNDALYSKYRNRPNLPKLVNYVLDAIINTNLINAGYSFGSLEPTVLNNLLPPDHPKLNINSWTEDELLLEVLSKSTSNNNDSGGSFCGAGAGGELSDNCIKLPSGKTIDLDNIDCDLILSEDTSEALEAVEAIQEIAKKAANNLRSRGKNPGSLSSSIIPPEFEETKSSNISWEDRLKQIAISSVNDRVVTNYDSLIQDNFYAYDLGLSSFTRCPIEYSYKPLPKPNTVVVYIDLSGSIFSCTETLSKFLFQITEISKYVGNLLLITFDVGMTGCHLFDINELDKPLGDLLIEEKSKYLIGGGGTDVIPLFEEFFNSYSNYDIEINVDNISMLIVLTDLWLEAVDKRLEPVNSKGFIPTLWVVPEDHCSSTVNFGEILLVK
jgi:predicted metal-dependent peptidase